MINLLIKKFLYEAWRFKQLFSKNSYGVYVITPELTGFIRLSFPKEEEIYYTSMIFEKALDEKEVFLNNKKGKLTVNWLNLNIEGVFDFNISEDERSNLTLDF